MYADMAGCSKKKFEVLKSFLLDRDMLLGFERPRVLLLLLIY